MDDIKKQIVAQMLSSSTNKYSFSANLTGVNGFDPIIKRSEELLKSTQEISSWFKKLSLMHETHAKSLLKNATLSKKKKTYTDTTEIGSLSSAWRCFHLQLESMGNIHLQAAKDLQTDVSDKIASFVVDKTHTRKKLVIEANKFTTEYKSSISALQKAKSSYETKCKDADIAQQAYLKAKQDGNIKPKKVQDLHTRATKLLDTATQSEKDYRNALDKANEKQERYFTAEMPSLLELFQSFEEERLTFLKNTFQRAAEIQNTFPTCYNNTSIEYTQISKDITVSGDIQEYIEENINSVIVPETLEYIPYETDNPNFKITTLSDSIGKVTQSTKSETTKKVYYGLTDQEEVKLSTAEKIEKLTIQVAELSENIVTEEGSRKGMEKLVKFYAKDPKSQEKALNDLEEQKKKIGMLEETRRNLESQIIELNNQGVAPQPAIPPIDNICIQAKALYTYEATNDSELTFQANDILTVTEQDESGWWFAELNGKSGFIPSNYMQVI